MANKQVQYPRLKAFGVLLLLLVSILIMGIWHNCESISSTANKNEYAFQKGEMAKLIDSLTANTYRRGDGVMDELKSNWTYPGKNERQRNAIWRKLRDGVVHTTADIDWEADILAEEAITREDADMLCYAEIALGSQFASQGDYTGALEIENEALNRVNTDARRLDNAWHPFCLFNRCYCRRVMGYTYRLMHNYSLADNMFRLAEKEQLKLKNTIQQGLLYSNIALVDCEMNTPRPNEARKYIDSCKGFIEGLQNQDIAHRDSVGIIYLSARYQQVNALLAIIEKQPVNVDSLFNLCFSICNADTTRRGKITYITAKLQYSAYLKKKSDMPHAIDAGKNALGKAESNGFWAQAIEAADSLRQLSPDTGRYSDTIVTLQFIQDSIQLANAQKHIDIIEKIHRRLEVKENTNHRIVFPFLVIVILAYLFLVFIWRRPSSLLLFIIIAEASGLLVHEGARLLTGGHLLALLIALILAGWFFHLVQEYVLKKKARQRA